MWYSGCSMVSHVSSCLTKVNVDLLWSLRRSLCREY
jgi:hypothetical protein